MGGSRKRKTYLMDLFFETLHFEQKMRLHFHRLMHKVHEELKFFSGKSDPIKHVARKISENAKVMCIDEFFVNDIGDAMILANLLDELFNPVSYTHLTLPTIYSV